LTKICFNGGDPRNATDYYYHSKTKTIYSNYWGEGYPGSWKANPDDIDINDIKSPSEARKILKKKDSKTKSEDDSTKSESKSKIEKLKTQNNEQNSNEKNDGE